MDVVWYVSVDIFLCAHHSGWEFCQFTSDDSYGRIFNTKIEGEMGYITME